MVDGNEPTSNSRVSSGGSKGLVLFLIATLLFIIAQVWGFSWIYVYGSFFLMIYTSIFLMESNGLFFVIAFSLWYIFSGSTDISSLKYWAPLIAIVSAALHGLITARKDGKAKFIPQAEQEFLDGLFPILIFIVDVGLINWAFGNNNYVLPELLRLILAWVPLWSYVGIVFMIKNGESGWMKTASIVVGIIYLIGVILVIPGGDVEASSFIPSAEELAKIRQDSKVGVNPFLINVKCAFSEITNMQACIQRKSNEARYKKICEEKDIMGDQLQTCISEEERKEKEVGSVQGTASSIVTESKEVDFREVAEEDFPRKSFRARDIYPINLEVDNPLGEKLHMVVSCSFRKGKENISGQVSIEGNEGDTFEVIETDRKTTIECTPAQDLNGTYDLDYSIDLVGVTTPSYLKRAFIPEIENYQLQQEMEDEIETIEFPRNRDALSQAPEDFARLNFKFGSGTGSNPIISVDKSVRFSWGVENLERGEILRINSYSFDSLLERGFTVDNSKVGDADCLQGGQMLIPATKIAALKSCWLQIPADLQGIEDYRVQTFAASFNYDYQITHTIRNIRVEPLTQKNNEGALVS